MPVITDKMLEAALQYLATSSEEAAAAKAERVRSEHGVKQVKARMMLEADGALGIREATAIASREYAVACEREAKAVEQDEWHRNQRNKADAIIEAWRSEQANQRAGNSFR